MLLSSQPTRISRTIPGVTLCHPYSRTAPLFFPHRSFTPLVQAVFPWSLSPWHRQGWEETCSSSTLVAWFSTLVNAVRKSCPHQWQIQLWRGLIPNRTRYSYSKINASVNLLILEQHSLSRGENTRWEPRKHPFLPPAQSPSISTHVVIHRRYLFFSKALTFKATVPSSFQQFPRHVPFTLLRMAPNHSSVKSALLFLFVCFNPHHLQLFSKRRNNTKPHSVWSCSTLQTKPFIKKIV